MGPNREAVSPSHGKTYVAPSNTNKDLPASSGLGLTGSNDDKEAANVLNYTYQEVPGALSDEEEMKDSKQVKRMTEQAQFNFDESLFLDKIKDFNPVESQMPEITELDPAEEFDIT